MSEDGPDLDTLLHRLADCPPAFLEAPRVRGSFGVHVDAVVGDLMWTLDWPVGDETVAAFRGRDGSQANWLRAVLVTCWLVGDPWFVARPSHAPRILQFLTRDLAELAEAVRAEAFVSNPDRREELVRLLLYALGQRPAGESMKQAMDRMKTVSTLDQQRVLEELREKRKRAQKLREEMKKQRAREAATRYSRE